MRSSYLGAGLLCASAAVATGLERLAEHVDIVPEFLDGTWAWSISTDFDPRDPTAVYFPVRDLDSSDGERFARPAGAQWDFLGIDEGEPVWIVPQSDNGFTWPGMENAQSGVFGSYLETDPRVAGIAQPWIRVELAGLEGPGDFSMFQIQGGSPVVWMASTDGLATEDVYFLASPGHDHMNWAFSEKGVYQVRLRASAFEGPGATNPTPASDEVSLFFSVGARADWRATHFPVDTVMNELVAGDAANPDEDQFENLLEYAFGTDPNAPSPLNLETGEFGEPELVMVDEGDERYPALRFLQRIHEDADLTYEVEWSDTLSGGWTDSGVEHEVEFIDESWQRVTIRDSRSVQGARFGRVRVRVPE